MIASDWFALDMLWRIDDIISQLESVDTAEGGMSMNTCGECYWYSDITVKKCDRENDPTTEDSKACSLFEPKEET